MKKLVRTPRGVCRARPRISEEEPEPECTSFSGNDLFGQAILAGSRRSCGSIKRLTGWLDPG